MSSLRDIMIIFVVRGVRNNELHSFHHKFCDACFSFAKISLRFLHSQCGASIFPHRSQIKFRLTVKHSISSRFVQSYPRNTFLIRDNVTPIDPLIPTRRFCHILFHWIYLSSRRTTHVVASEDNSGSCVTPFTIRSSIMSRSRGIARVSGKWDFRRASGHRANPIGPHASRSTVTRNKGKP